QVVSLLEAFDTPVMSPDTFMEGIHGAEWSNETGNPSPLDELPGSEVETLIDRSIPDLVSASGARGAPDGDSPPNAGNLPHPDDRSGLETMIAELARETGATAAALLIRRGGMLERAAAFGSGDR